MSPALWMTVAVTCVLGVFVALTLAARHRERAELASARRAVEDLRVRLEELEEQVAEQVAEQGAEPDAPSGPRHRLPDEFVITSVPEIGTAPADEPHDERPLTAGEFTSVAVGESLVRIVSLGHGVRRALSAESRNRIRFEMRREVKRARKQRRRDLKEAKRHLRDTEGREAA